MDKPVIEDNHDGTVSIRYDPREEGQHELSVKFNGEHVQGLFEYNRCNKMCRRTNRLNFLSSIREYLTNYYVVSDFSDNMLSFYRSLGSPFKFHVDSLASGYVTAYGPGLIYGVCGEPGNFNISTKDAGAGGLSLSVEGPSKAEISCHDNKDGTISVSYLPTAPGEYKIGVKFGDKHIRGSPYVAKITGTRDHFSSRSRSCLKNLQIKEKDTKYLSRDLF